MTKKLIWDLPIRIVHWLLTVLIFGSWYTVSVTGNMEAHMLIGQTILCLLIFRVVWGFVGTRYAKFSSFVFGPHTIIAYARTILSRSGGGYAGHNPLGFLAVFAMLLLIGIQVTTGLFATDGDFYEGPLNHLVSGSTGREITDIHYLNFDVLAIMIGIHIVAIFFYLLYKRENLIWPMFTGTKTGDALQAIGGSKLGLAIGVLVASAAGVYLLVTLL